MMAIYKFSLTSPFFKLLFLNFTYSFSFQQKLHTIKIYTAKCLLNVLRKVCNNEKKYEFFENKRIQKFKKLN